MIAVAPAMQGSGLGAALLHAGIDHLRPRGLGAVALYVESDNPAVRLYQRIGFTHAADRHPTCSTRAPSCDVQAGC